MADTTPGSSDRTSSEALFRGAASPVQAREFAAELADALQDCATALLDEQRIRAANEIATLGEVLHRSVKSLDPGGGGTVARYTDDAAGQISQFADRLRRRSLAELSGGIEDFARRWPAVFIASAVGVGLIAGRLLASSASRPAKRHPDAQGLAGQRTPQSSARQPVSTGEARPGDTWHDDPVVDAIASGSAKPSPAASARENG
jgi:hypothetical protein